MILRAGELLGGEEQELCPVTYFAQSPAPSYCTWMFNETVVMDLGEVQMVSRQRTNCHRLFVLDRGHGLSLQTCCLIPLFLNLLSGDISEIQFCFCVVF